VKTLARLIAEERAAPREAAEFLAQEEENVKRGDQRAELARLRNKYAEMK
jgi:hypothetical protein